MNQTLHLHSGGAKGADLAWESVAAAAGLPLTATHWRTEHYHALDSPAQALLKQAVSLAGKTLGRPTYFRGVELVYRNWFQVHNAQSVYAISTILQPGEKDARGLKNRATVAVVAGGTGWAVQMAIDMAKPVFVYDQRLMAWYQWDYATRTFLACGIPTLTAKFAGIGTRELSPEGWQAIKDIYQLHLAQTV